MFLLLVAGDGGAAMWILILQEHPGESRCLDFLCEAGWCLSGGVPNKSGLFPTGGMDGGVKLLFLLLLSVRLVLSSGARCSAVLVISSFADCGVVRIVFPVVGLLWRIADFLSNGGSCFRSPAFGPVAAEPLPLFYFASCGPVLVHRPSSSRSGEVDLGRHRRPSPAAALGV